MYITKRKQPKEDLRIQQSEYGPYEVIKSQLSYFYREGGINKAQKELLENPQVVFSFVIPAKNNSGDSSRERDTTTKGFLVKHGRTRESFVRGIIFDPEITEEKLKASALSGHLQARLAGIPFEPLVLGIKSQREYLTINAMSQIENHLKKIAVSPFGNFENRLPVSTNNISSNGFSFSDHFFSELLTEIKKLEFPGKNKISVSSSEASSFTDKVFKLLAEKNFKILPPKDKSTAFRDVLILSRQNPLTVSEARNIQAKVVIDGCGSIISPETRMAFAESNILVVPNIITTLPEIIKAYFAHLASFKFHISEAYRLKNEANKIATKTFRDTWSLASQNSISLTSAAFALAVNRATKVQSYFYPFSAKNSGDRDVK